MEENTPTIESVVQHDLSSLVIQAELPANTNIAPTDYKALHQAKIDALKADAEALPAIVDNKTAQANQAMLTRLVTARTSIDKYRLNMTEPLRAQLAAVNAYLGVKGEGGLQEKLKAIEGPLVQRKEAWEDEQEKKRQEELAAREARTKGRAEMLLGKGLKFDGTVYHLEELIIHHTDVWNLDDDGWEKWCKDKLVPKATAYQEKQQRLQNRLQRLLDLGMERARRGDGQHVLRLQGLEGVAEVTENDIGTIPDEAFDHQLNTMTMIRDRRKEHEERVAAEAAKKAEEERAAKEAEDARMKALFEKQQAEQKKLDEDRAALDAEKAKLRQEKQDSRERILLDLGAQKVDHERGLMYVVGSLFHVVGDLALLSDENWEMAKDGVRRSVETLSAQTTNMEQRSERLKELGVLYDGESTWSLGGFTVTDHLLMTMSEDQWVEKLQELTFEIEAQVKEESAEEAPATPADDSLERQRDAMHAVELAMDEMRLSLETAKERLASHELAAYHINLAWRFYESMETEVRNVGRYLLGP